MSKSLRKSEQLNIQAALIAEKKELLAQKQKNLKLLESYTQSLRR